MQSWQAKIPGLRCGVMGATHYRLYRTFSWHALRDSRFRFLMGVHAIIETTQMSNTILSIINEEYVLVGLERKDINEGTILKVLSIVEIKPKVDKLAIDVLTIPKGTLRIVKYQQDYIYLASVYERTEQRIRKVGGLGMALGLRESLLSKLTEHEVVQERVAAGRSAAVNIEESLDIKIDHRISVGDRVEIS